MESPDFGTDPLDREGRSLLGDAISLVAVLHMDYLMVEARLRSFEVMRDKNYRGVDASTTFDWNIHARDVIRTFFAYLEGTIYSLKVYVDQQLEHAQAPLSSEEQAVVYELQYYVDEKGQIKTKPMNIKLTTNLLFMVSLFDRISKTQTVIDRNSQWWIALKKAIAIRNHITHPKSYDEFFVNREQFMKIDVAYKGFNTMLSTFLGDSTWSLPIKLVTPYEPFKPVPVQPT